MLKWMKDTKLQHIHVNSVMELLLQNPILETNLLCIALNAINNMSQPKMIKMKIKNINSIIMILLINRQIF